MRKPKNRVYWRNQGGELRAYADLRDVGGGREALIPKGETRATTDPVIAASLLSNRLAELQESKRDRHLLGVRRRASLQQYAAEHLVNKKRSGKVTDVTLQADERHLQVAIDFFGREHDLASIRVEDIQRFAHHLSNLPTRRDGRLSPSSQRKYLNSLSNLLRRAQGEGLLLGVNPVQAMMDKPSGDPHESRWLEVWECALLLEAARKYPYNQSPPADARVGERIGQSIVEVLGANGTEEFVQRMRAAGRYTSMEKVARYTNGEAEPTKAYVLAAAEALGLPPERLYRSRSDAYVPPRVDRIMYPLIATYLLTGGRESEVYGLEMRDVSIERRIVVFRVTTRRRLKTRTSSRIVTLWPQLSDIIGPWLEERRADGAGDSDLVFPSPKTGGILADCRKGLDAIARRVGWASGDIRTRMFRHSYCAARLQSLDGGHPVALYTVSRELGHGSETLVKKVYSHLGQIRHRSEFVEYRIEQQRDVIPAERMRLLLQAV